MASQKEEGQAEDVQAKQEMNEKRQLSLYNGRRQGTVNVPSMLTVG